MFHILAQEALAKRSPWTSSCPHTHLLAAFQQGKSLSPGRLDRRKNERPELAKVLTFARLAGATLVIAKLDRLSCNAAFLLTLRDSGVRFVACDMPEANDLTVGIMALVAQQEREAISRRTKEAGAAAKARGSEARQQQWRCRPQEVREGRSRTQGGGCTECRHVRGGFASGGRERAGGGDDHPPRDRGRAERPRNAHEAWRHLAGFKCRRPAPTPRRFRRRIRSPGNFTRQSS